MNSGRTGHRLTSSVICDLGRGWWVASSGRRTRGTATKGRLLITKLCTSQSYSGTLP